MIYRLFAFATIALAALLFILPVKAYENNTYQQVTPAHMYSWVFLDDQTGRPGTGTIVSGPATPPMGAGSINFDLTGNNEEQVLATTKYHGILLSRFTNMTYSTYQAASNPDSINAISLQLAIDANTSPPVQMPQGRMVYEPSLNNSGSVPLGVWHQWDTISGGNGKWWFTRSAQAFNGNCPRSNPCTWSQILTLYPNMRVHPTQGKIVLEAANGLNSFNGNADALTISVDGYDLSFDFDP